jgi:hypothetical protein
LSHRFSLRQTRLRNIGTHHFAAYAGMRRRLLAVRGENGASRQQDTMQLQTQMLAKQSSSSLLLPQQHDSHDASNAIESQQKESVLPS